MYLPRIMYYNINHNNNVMRVGCPCVARGVNVAHASPTSTTRRRQQYYDDIYIYMCVCVCVCVYATLYYITILRVYYGRYNDTSQIEISSRAIVFPSLPYRRDSVFVGSTRNRCNYKIYYNNIPSGDDGSCRTRTAAPLHT
jgi:hypothetical protein